MQEDPGAAAKTQPVKTKPVPELRPGAAAVEAFADLPNILPVGFARTRKAAGIPIIRGAPIQLCISQNIKDGTQYNITFPEMQSPEKEKKAKSAEEMAF